MPVTINASTSSGLVQTADTSGTVEIQSNGTTRFTVASTGAYGQLVSDTAKTATSTAVDFTGIPSWVKRITVMFQGVSTNGTSPIQIQLGTGATPTYTTSGYLGSVDSWGNAVAATTRTTGLGIERLSAATYVRHGLATIVNITSNSWSMNSLIGLSDSGIMSVGAGSIALGAALTAVRITTVNGTDTFDAGTINILYEG